MTLTRGEWKTLQRGDLAVSESKYAATRAIKLLLEEFEAFAA